MWRVAAASEYLVITGYSIPDVKLAKKGWILPGQRCSAFDIAPVNYSFDVQAMSAEKLPFTLPAVFTIGPKCDDMEALRKYAKLVAPHNKNSNHVRELVMGVIEGETRALTAGATMEEIFKGTKQFKANVFEKVQLVLDDFGLYIYNANVKQLVDVKGYEYFSYLSQKTQQEAANHAKVDVAEAKYKGDVGAKKREGLTSQKSVNVEAETRIYAKQQEAMVRQQESKLEAETKIYQNSRKAEMAQADAELATKSALCWRQAELAKVEAEKAAASREAELQKEVAQRNVDTETQRLRAVKLSSAVVQYETAVQGANATLYEKQRIADAENYERQRSAEACQREADAALYASMKNADAKLYDAQQQAGAYTEAPAAYARAMLQAFGGNYASLNSYLPIDRRIYQNMGRINAQAIQGLSPKISIWSTRNEISGTTASRDFGNGMHKLPDAFKTHPPLFTTIKDQAGITHGV